MRFFSEINMQNISNMRKVKKLIMQKMKFSNNTISFLCSDIMSLAHAHFIM